MGVPSSKKVIHVVEDNKSVREAIHRVLTQAGHVVRALESGVELEQALKREQPDLILIDVMLPHATGYDVLERLTAKGALGNVPAIVMSGLPRERMRPPPPLADLPFLSKPFDIYEMRRMVADVLAAAQPSEPAPEEKPAPAEPSRRTQQILRALEQALGR